MQLVFHLIKSCLVQVEMQLAVSSHEGFVTLTESITSPKVAYLVMEICQGGELYDNVGANENYTEVQAAHYARQLCDAMAFMHNAGAIHRDLKPKNILISTTSEIGHRLRICDFGLATWLKEGEWIEDGVIKGNRSASPGSQSFSSTHPTYVFRHC